jgi:site-specific DNA-cytosine methylase
MAKLKRILAADLFCGAGGTSTGLLRAAELLNRRVELTAVNHWDRAIETHSANHPGANHFCQSLADLDPKRGGTGREARPARCIPGVHTPLGSSRRQAGERPVDEHPPTACTGGVRPST